MTTQEQYRFDDAFVRNDEALRDEDGEIDDISLDLLDLSTAAYLADRKSPRGAPGTDGWRRALSFELPARRPEIWQRPAVRLALLDLLHWLSEDDWSFTVARRGNAYTHFQLALPLDGADREVALFSGGLDSTAGAALLLAENAPVLGVSVWTNQTMRRYQRLTAQALNSVRGWSLETCSLQLSKVGVRSHEERTRRTRGLVFLAAGWSAAIAARRSRLLVLENGVGAVNLPCTAAQSGCMTSRSVHPRTLQLAERVFSLVRDEPFAIINPHVAETKAHMLARLPASARLACSTSESCDFAAAGRGTLQRRCGRCSSCLLRRMSLHASGRSDWDERPYLADVQRNNRIDSDLSEMLWQAGLLETALREPDQYRALVQEFPQLADVPGEVICPSDVVAMYSAYLSEWRSYPHYLIRSFLSGDDMAA